MDGLILRLLPDDREPQDLALLPHRLESSILDTANANSAYVFCDFRYHAQLVNSSAQIKNLQFLVNGNALQINYSPESGNIIFCDTQFGARIFLECYGFVQITLIYEDVQGNSFVQETEYIQVMVRKGRQNDSVRRMTEYIYHENIDLLYGDKTLPKDAAGLQDGSSKTLESYILLLKQISVVLEENYRYFKTNSRFITVPQERVDHFEKLQFASHNTIQYITQHPEELQKVYHSSGIRIGNSRYQPNKTLIKDNVRSFDIYENRVIVGFIGYLIRAIDRIETELVSIISNVPQRPMETDDYVTSSYYIYASTIASIKIILSDIKDLHHKYTNLYSSYAEILPVKPEYIYALPKYTPVFRSIPQYHQIYNCIVAWLSKGVFSLNEERYMLSFLKISVLYEVYVLAKLINYFKGSGYSLEMIEQKIYPFSVQSMYENTECNNYFVFKNGKSKVTLYYQPVIYNFDKREISGIGLYRNTSISFPNIDGESATGKYYTPDYLIKYEYEGRDETQYVIADAKFSTIKTVKQRQVAKLAYKYLFSVSPIENTDKIVALCVFNGQSESPYDIMTNIYDFGLNQAIMPLAEIVTLTENAKTNKERHKALFKNSVGLYTNFAQQIPVQIATIPAFSDEQSASSHTNEEPVIITHDNAQISPVIENVPVKTNNNDVEVANNSTPIPSPKAASKTAKRKQERAIDFNTISISELKLPLLVEKNLQDAGYNTIAELVPNSAQSDLDAIPYLNRKLRRGIEGKLKEKHIKLK